MRALPKIAGSVMGAAWLAIAAQSRAQPFSSPVGCDGCINYWYYVDHGDGTDYDCGSATYSGHRGSDYSLRGGNSAIDDGNEVVAAAAGVVTVAVDGNYDRCTACGGEGCGTNTPGGGFSNYVVIDHGTHTTTYGHMRMGSIMVGMGDSVECGQVIGHIGSAGCSSGAHLHFEPRVREGSRSRHVDPYAGDCSTTLSSLWGQQGPYRGLPGKTCADAPPECPLDTYEIWTCTPDGGSRRRCIDGADSTEECAWGCEQMPSGTDDACALPPDGDGDGVRADTDCDDDRADVHPGALELCGDGIDQDCSGADAACDPGGNGGAGPGAGGMTGVGGMGAAAPVGGTASSSGGAPAFGGMTGGAGIGAAAAAGGTIGSSAGAGVAGSPAVSGSGASSVGRSQPPAVEGGCACHLTGPASRSRQGLLLLLGSCGLVLGRRASARGRRPLFYTLRR